MRILRRNLLRLAGGAIALAATPGIVRAQAYPARTVHLVAGFAPGGPADITARLIAQWLSERLGQPFIVENRPGGASNLAAEMVARAQPDGYTLLEVTSVNAWNATLYDNLRFDIIRDIAPIASISRSGGVLSVNPSFPARSVAEFIAYAKANPGKINLGSAGQGSAPHLYGELFAKMAGVDLVHVHYRSSGPALTDVVAGQLQATFDPVASSIGLIRGGKLRPLGVTTATRMDVLPDVPPIGDFVSGYEAVGFQALGAPRDTPPEVVAILNQAINAALADPAFRARLVDLGVEPFASSPDEYGKFIAAYTEKWAKVIRGAGIKLQ
jgi:tripartite-type tricarboxylate transporter receptor subunit TctC